MAVVSQPVLWQEVAVVAVAVVVAFLYRREHHALVVVERDGVNPFQPLLVIWMV